MDKTLEPPYGLTKTSLKYPHRVKPNRQGVKMSAMEASFSTGNLEEIKYWMDTGILDEGLDGKTRFRGDYTRSLMTHLAEYLGRVLVSSEENLHKYDEILSYLWNKGAKKHTGLYQHWLKGLTLFDMADLIVEQGVDPWVVNGGQDTEYSWLSSSWPKGAVESILSLMGSLQFSHKIYGAREINEDLNARVIQRAKSWMDMPSDKADELSLRRCLGLVARGDLETHYYGKDPAPEIKRLWPEFRNKLIALGAGAIMDDRDALYYLMVMGPQKPLHRYEAISSIRKERIENGDERYKKYAFYDSDSDISEEDLGARAQKLIEERAHNWKVKSSEWIEALAPAIRAHNSSEVVLNVESASLWERLMDTPGGVKLGQKIAEVLIDTGQQLPWDVGGVDRWNRSSILCLTADGPRRSLRKITNLRKLFQHPPIKAAGISKTWINDLLKGTIALQRANDTPNSPPPGMCCEPKSEKTTYSSGRRKRKAPKVEVWVESTLPNPLEMDPVIDLALVNFSTQDWLFDNLTLTAGSWLPHFLAEMPKSWSKYNTPEDEAETQLGILSRRGILSSALKSGERALEAISIAREGDVKKAAEKLSNSMDEISSLGFYAWANSKYYNSLMKEAVALDSRNGDDLKLLRTLNLFQAWYINMETNPISEKEKRLGDEFGQAYLMAKETMRNEPELKAVAAHMVLSDILETPSYESWEGVKTKLGRGARMIDMGWRPGENEKDLIMRETINKVVNLNLSDEGQAELIAFTSKMGVKKEVFVEVLLENVFQTESESSPKMEWVWMADIALENKWSPQLPTSIDLAGKTLGLYFKNATRRRDLKDIAQNIGGYDKKHPEQRGRGGLRM